MKSLKRILFIFSLIFVGACNAPLKEGVSLEATKFAEKINNEKNAVLLDVRTSGEFTRGALQNAINIDINSSNFEAEVSKLDKNKVYLVYCLSGARSASAVNYMLKNGFKEAYNLQGGLLAWQRNNLPMSSVSPKPSANELSIADYQKLTTSNEKVLIDFYAPWCAPCRKMEPMLEELGKENAKNLKVIRINIDENQELAKELGIEEIPILKIFNKGKETWMHKGLVEKDIIQKNF